MNKQGPVNTFAVKFTGKQAKAIEAVAKTKGISPEAMVRQAVRDALDKASNKQVDHKHLETYMLKLLGNRKPPVPPPTPASSRQALEKRVLSLLPNEDKKRPKR